MLRKLFLMAFVCLLPALAQVSDDAVDSVQWPEDIAEYVEAKESQKWCLTDQLYEEQRQSHLLDACPLEGNCDNTNVRDATLIDAKSINVIVHVIRDNNGNNGISQATVDASIAQMNADFAQANISFNLVATRFHNNSTYSCISAYSPFSNAWQTEIQNMKATYAETPNDNINIFVSCQDPSSFGTLLGIATFPWENHVLSNTGGLWMNNSAMGAGAHTLSHEMGHCLGLWHTHHGVSEVNSCSTCYEYASGVEGDERGDFCSDTPPTPTNQSCSDPGGSDCQGTAWGNTQTENFMGYAPDSCMNLFTGQQISRMHCWTNDVLSSWLGGGSSNNPPSAGFSVSTNNLTANFTDASSDSDGSIVSRSWNFGDGNSSNATNPSHTYASGGSYTVTLTVTDDDGATDSASQTVTVSAGGIQCNTTISSFPYSESFESGLGAWTQASGDDLNWTRDSNGTPSNGTGPSSGSNGSWYMYIEASSPNYPSKNAIFNSPCYDLSSASQATFSFDYHMNGNAVGTVSLQASTDGVNWNTEWTRSGSQGSAWNNASVNLDAYAGGTVKLRFNGTTGSSWQGDIAVDNLNISTGTGGGGTTTVTVTINTDNYPGETTWEIKSGSTVVASGGPYGTRGSTEVANVVLADGCYDFVIYDSYGDGICCGFGNGSYTVTANGSTLASGGNFSSSETTQICF